MIDACFIAFAMNNVAVSEQIHPDSLSDFIEGKGRSLRRSAIHTTLAAVIRNRHSVGAAVKIADNLYLTASHIVSDNPEQYRIQTYTNPKAFPFSVIAQDKNNDIALLNTQETDTPKTGSVVKLGCHIPLLKDTVSYLTLLSHAQSETYETELYGKQPFFEDSGSDDFFLGKLISPKGSFVYEIEGYLLPYDVKAIADHLKRNQIAKKSAYGPEILADPQYACMTTISGFNGASGGGVFKESADGLELVGIVTVSVTEKHLIEIPKSPRGFTRLQQNYTLFTHRRAIVELIQNHLHK